MDDGKQLIYTHFVAGAAALAVLEDGDVAAGRHAVVGRQVDVLDPARAAVVGGAGALGLAVPGGPGGEPLAVMLGPGGNLGCPHDPPAASAARTARRGTIWQQVVFMFSVAQLAPDGRLSFLFFCFALLRQ